MDIQDLKDIVKTEEAATKPSEKNNEEVKEAVEKALAEIEDQSRYYNVPEDSKCLSDIQDIHDIVKAFIKTTFEKIGTQPKEQRQKDIDCCMDAIKVVDFYKNVRINVELSSKIKFEIVGKK